MKKIFILIFVAFFAVVPFAVADETDSIAVTVYDIAAMSFNVVEDTLTYTISSTDTTGEKSQDITIETAYEVAGSTVDLYLSLFGGDSDWLAVGAANGIKFYSDGVPLDNGPGMVTDPNAASAASLFLGAIPCPTGGVHSEVCQLKISCSVWHGIVTPGSTVTGAFDFIAIVS